MKMRYFKIPSSLAVLSGLVLLSSCHTEDPGPLQETSRQYNIVDFERLEMGSAFIIDVKRADDYSITAKGDIRNIDDLKVHKSGNTLVVKFDNSYNRKHDTYITITMPTLEGVKFSGASDSHIGDFSNVDKFDFNLSGASTSQVDIEASQLNIDLSGASHLRISGVAEELVAEVSGASKLSAFNLVVDKANVRVSGASEVKVNVTSSLDAKASGASSIVYQGSPVVTGNTSGASSIHHD